MTSQKPPNVGLWLIAVTAVVLVGYRPVSAQEGDEIGVYPIAGMEEGVFNIADLSMHGRYRPTAHPARVLVRFQRGTSPATRQTAHDAAQTLEILTEYHAVSDLLLVRVPEGKVDEAVEAYRNAPGVLYAEPDYIGYAVEVPDDPYFDVLWGLQNTGQTVYGDPGTAGADIRAVDAWDITTGDPDLRIAVIDTGVNYNHQDLEANMWTNPGEIPGNGIDDDGNGYIDDVHGIDTLWDDSDPMDDHGHGSHCSGTIGGVGNNGRGVAGVNWECQIVAVKFISAGGGGYVSDAVEAFQYVIDNDIRISSNSWAFIDAPQSLYDAVEATQAIGHIVVAAAANGCPFFGNPTNIDVFPYHPASYDLPNIVSVAATNNDDIRASFTNYGPASVDLGAPGVFVYSTVLGAGYGYKSGTSMATPHVAGLLALVAARSPELTWQELLERVFLTVRPLDDLAGFTTTGGIINARAAVGDCNENGILDEQDISGGTSTDCNDNGVPDECEIYDCNQNSVPDSCDITAGTSNDCDENGVPDECEPDCNDNGIADACDIAGGVSEDCNGNGVPDECEPGGTEDCNSNGSPDLCDVTSVVSRDCNDNDVPDECDIADGTLNDSDGDGVADECWQGFSFMPVGATGEHTIEGNHIFLAEGGQRVTLDIRVSGWDLDMDGEPLLRGYQAAPDASGFTNVLNGSLDFPVVSCNTYDDCRAGPVGHGWCMETGFCDLTTVVYVDASREDFVYADVPSMHGAFDYVETAAAGALTWDDLDSAPDMGRVRYGGTIELDVSPDAEGAFVVGVDLHDGAFSLWLDFSGATMPLPDLIPAVIVLPSDCNENGIPDYDDVINGTSDDCNSNFIPDECEPDCNENGIADECDLTAGTSEDCNENEIPDECELEGNDCNSNAVPDECDPDCQPNGTPDDCDIDDGTSQDCNENDLPDECDISDGTSEDCNENGIPDECDIANGTSPDDLPPGGDGIPDECQSDCNENGVPDALEPDCNENGVADECDINDGTSEDCNSNWIPDECEPDCNGNGVADDCDIADGTSDDDNGNGIPDECDVIFYVDLGAVGANDGTSWDDAFVNLQDALDFASDPLNGVTELWVASGIYRPDRGTFDQTTSFELVDGIMVYGGFVAGGARFDERDFRTNETILTCDLLGDDGPDFSGNDENCYTVVIADTDVTTGGLDGFVIVGGNSDADQTPTEDRYGGGLYATGSPRITNCIFERNTAESGGGAAFYSWGARGILTNCIFRSNSAALYGGGVMAASSGPTLINCAFVGNTSYRVGGMSVAVGSVHHTAVTNCTFFGNTATADTAGLQISNTHSGTAEVVNCILWGNVVGGSSVDESAQIRMIGDDWSINHSCVQGWTGDLGGVGNIGDDPLFIDADGDDDIVGTADDDLRLSLGSPAMDTGDNSAVTVTTDLDGGPRILSSVTGETPIVDMGAYEHGEDCNANGIADDVDIADGTSEDCNGNIVPDECDLADGTSEDCNANTIPDECDIASGASEDCNSNGVPDECEPDEDCNENGVQDICDIAAGTSVDCNANNVPDECDLADGTSSDVNENGIPDECDSWTPRPEDSLSLTCIDDGECDNAATCIQGVCYAPKNRYISIGANPDNEEKDTARRINLETVGTGTILLGWVGEPALNPIAGVWTALVVDSPIYEGVDFEGDWPEVVHVTDCVVAPGETYLIQAIASGQPIEDEDYYSEALALQTAPVWGDVVTGCPNDVCSPPQGDPLTQPNIDDVLALVNAFQGVPNAPLAWLDIDPVFADGYPEGVVTIGDVLAVVNAFTGQPYPGDGPLGCP
jgi:subtilisin family serine protease